MNREKYYRQYKLGGFMQKILIGLGVFLMLSISANAQSPQESKPNKNLNLALIVPKQLQK